MDVLELGVGNRGLRDRGEIGSCDEAAQICKEIGHPAAHRLLGQPHSFEGFVLLAVLAAFGDLAAA